MINTETLLSIRISSTKTLPLPFMVYFIRVTNKFEHQADTFIHSGMCSRHDLLICRGDREWTQLDLFHTRSKSDFHHCREPTYTTIMTRTDKVHPCIIITRKMNFYAFFMDCWLSFQLSHSCQLMSSTKHAQQQQGKYKLPKTKYRPLLDMSDSNILF